MLFFSLHSSHHLVARATCIRKSSFTAASTAKEDQKGGGGGTQDSTPKHRPKVRSRSKSKSIHGSMSQVSESTSAHRGRSRSSSSLNHGKSWSNLTHACSMTSVQEEGGTRRATSSSSELTFAPPLPSPLPLIIVPLPSPRPSPLPLSLSYPSPRCITDTGAGPSYRRHLHQGQFYLHSSQPEGNVSEARKCVPYP